MFVYSVKACSGFIIHSEEGTVGWRFSPRCWTKTVLTVRWRLQVKRWMRQEN